MANTKSKVSVSKTIGGSNQITLGFQSNGHDYSRYVGHFYIQCEDSKGKSFHIGLSEENIREFLKFVETAKSLVK